MDSALEDVRQEFLDVGACRGVSEEPTVDARGVQPSWQNTQVPSENANGITTTSPAFRVRTSAPTASTTPMASCPRTLPVSLGSIDLYGQRSLPQMQACVTETRASVASMIRGRERSRLERHPRRT
jgi:hypothetical protein